MGGLFAVEVRDVDYVLTAKQLADVLNFENIDLFQLEKGNQDDPLGISTGAGRLFGTTGGVMEAAVRTVYELVSGEPLEKLQLEEVRGLESFRKTTLEINPSPMGALGPALAEAGVSGPVQLRVGVVHGLGDAKKVVKAVQEGSVQVDFCEVMACPGGCIGGAGNAKATPQRLAERQQALYGVDERLTVRRSHENTAVLELYKEFLGEPNSELAHKLLHTHYTEGGASAVEKHAKT